MSLPLIALLAIAVVHIERYKEILVYAKPDISIMEIKFVIVAITHGKFQKNK